MTNQRACANTPGLSRRTFMTLAPVAIMATPSAAGVTPTPFDEPALPDWWEKLTGASAETDPEVFAPWADDETNRKLAVKLQELHDLLLESAPDGIHTITDFRMRFSTGTCPQNVIVMGRSGYWGDGLHCFRPEFGWIDRTPRIAT